MNFRTFDFENPETFDAALENIDVVFILRPPDIADVKKYFIPLFDIMRAKKVNKVVFLSVQGVENQKFIPHYKIEKAILDYKFDYIFLRPSYFMQNLTTTFLKGIKEQKKIFIPSGNLKFNWVDTKDIGSVGAKIMLDFDNYKNQEYEITGKDFEDFNYVCELLTEILNLEIKYESPNIFKFYSQKKKSGNKSMMIFVMLMLHYLPRLKKNKIRLTDTVEKIADKEPITLREFIQREKESFLI